METQASELTIDTNKVETESAPLLDSAQGLLATIEPYRTIATAEEAAQAADWLNTIAAEIKQREAWFAPMKKAAHEAHKAITVREGDVIKPLRDSLAILRGGLSGYQREQERLGAIERARIAAEERQREDDRRLAEAEALERAGESEEAEAVIVAPVVHAPAPVVAPKVAGVNFRETWKAEVVSKAALIKAAAANPALINLLDINQSACDALARAQKEHLNLPGVLRAVMNKVPAAMRRG